MTGSGYRLMFSSQVTDEPWNLKIMKAEMRHGRYSRERSSPTQWNIEPSRRLGRQVSGEAERRRTMAPAAVARTASF